MATEPASHSSYSVSLRVIGQSLETQQPDEFDLEIINGEFVINLPAQESSLWSKVRKLKGSAFGFKRRDKGPTERRYSAQRVEELDQEGRSKRVKPDETPDFYRVSQTLRTVGAYVDHTSFRLVGLSRRGARLMLRLEASDGRGRTEEHLVSSFHNYFLQLYIKRRKRTLASHNR